ncbi:MAG TPA: hypothetical protein VFC74_06800, partial [Oscillospiraceae bacterium]|nr:hypothetical protein [Oscillospiraceae bacterium]
MKYVGKTDLKIGNNAVWHGGNFVPDDKADKSHGHTKSQITDFPSSLPANGGTANKANILVITDTRDIDDTPGDLQKKGFTGAFKRRATVNNPPVGSSNNYVFIMTVAGYGTASDGSGGWPIQVAFGIEGLAYRRGTSSTAWGPWDRISNLSDIPTSLPANGGNAATVNGKTVAENVPAGAKFTDTTYSEITTSEIDAGTSSTLRTISGRRVKYIL